MPLAIGILTFVVTLVLYASLTKRKPKNQKKKKKFVSILPVLGTLLFIKLTKRFASWRGVAIVYVVLFVLVVIIQAAVRLLSVS